MSKLALVYLDGNGDSFVGIFNDEGNITEFHPFSSDKSFSELGDNRLGICKFTPTSESGFSLDVLAMVEVSVRPTKEGDDPSYCTAEEFVNDPERDEDAFKVIFETYAISFDEPRVLH